jgi:hypothetical protein
MFKYFSWISKAQISNSHIRKKFSQKLDEPAYNEKYFDLLPSEEHIFSLR